MRMRWRPERHITCSTTCRTRFRHMQALKSPNEALPNQFECHSSSTRRTIDTMGSAPEIDISSSLDPRRYNEVRTPFEASGEPAKYAYPNPQMFDQKDTDNFLHELTPTQEHFLKKYLLENRLSAELHELADPDCCESLGPPFKVKKETKVKSLPLLTFFFNNYLTTFPFITNNSQIDQMIFWQETVQPFIHSFNQKNISNSEERKENITKRRQVNKKFLSGLLLFYNSVIITEKDLTYLQEAHLKPSDTGKLDKIQSKRQDAPVIVHSLTEYEKMTYFNDLSINIVTVRLRTSTAGSPSTGNPLSHSVSPPRSIPGLTSWNPLKAFLSESPAPRHHYEFVIQITARDLNSQNKYDYHSHFVSHPYHDFKTLASSLRKLFPGLMSTEAPHLPVKVKHDEGFTDSDSASVESDHISLLSGNSSRTKNNKLAREKLRLSLRGYLTALIKFPEIVHSPPLQDFFTVDSFKTLSQTDEADHLLRLEHERNILATQFEFQRQTAQVMMQLSEDFDTFKSELIMKPQTIVDIFKEIGVTPDIKDLSPLLRTFNEWSKLEVAATLYQVFLGQDNSNEWFIKCKKFHRLFPYSVVYGILRFTNPVKIVSRVVDLLLVNFPSFSLPSWGWSRAEEDEDIKKGNHKSAAGGSRNLLSMIFIMLLDEDLNDFTKELKSLREEKVHSSYYEFLERIDSYVTLSNETVAEIHHQALEQDQDLLLTILSTPLVEPQVISEDNFQNIVESYEAYEAIGTEKEIGDAELYLHLKQYWQVLVRKKDKDLTKQLWQEPELTKLIKNFLTIFYQPLMKLFGKSDVHLVFKDFQSFMDDLIEELTRLNNEEMYFLSSIEIFNRLKQLLDKHEKTMWNFIHNIYKKDEQELFLKLIEWIQNFLVLIRLKFVDAESVTLDIAGFPGVEELDQELFMKQLNSRLNKVVIKRKLYNEYLKEKSKINESSVEGQLEKNWQQMNTDTFGGMDISGLGVDDDDMQEFNILHAEDDFSKSGNKNALHITDNLDRKLQRDLHELEHGNNLGTSELDKLDGFAHSQLVTMLKRIDINT